MPSWIRGNPVTKSENSVLRLPASSGKRKEKIILHREPFWIYNDSCKLHYGDSMFGIGFQEILLVLLIALIFFGPKKLPDLARSLGRGVAEFKKAADEVKRSFEEVVEEESLKKELKDELQELKDMGSDLEKDVKKEVGDLEDDLKKIDEDAKTADGKVKEFSSPDEG